MPTQSDRLRSTSTRRINSFREYVIFGGMSEVSSLSYDDFVHQIYQIQSIYLKAIKEVIHFLLTNTKNYDFELVKVRESLVIF
jgi:hypothetical protein